MKSDRDRAVGLRLAGASYAAIADQLDIPVADVESLVADELTAITSESREASARLQLARLDALMMPVWKQAVRGDAQSVAHALKIIGQQTALIQKLEDDAAAPAGGDDAAPGVSMAAKIAALKAAHHDEGG